MAQLNEGDAVVATKDFGGVARPRITRGREGVVVRTSWLSSEVTVAFGSDQVEVSSDEIRKKEPSNGWW